jgi:hypothetical protein
MAETYPIAQMTIEGQTFEVIEPYKEGDVLSANEASQLNQVFRENVGNNIRKQIKDMLSAAQDHAAIQTAVSSYAEAYEFGNRAGGGGRRDPVRSEAIAIAVGIVKDKIKSSGRKVTDYPMKVVTDLARNLIDSGKRPDIWDMAADRVEQAKTAAKEVADDLDSLIRELQPENKQQAA